MPRQLIKKPLPILGPACTTERASRGLKNLYRGKSSEELVLEYFNKKNFEVLAQRWKSPFAEIDLVLKGPDKRIYLVEVKTVKSLDFISECLGQKQKQRLRKSLIACSENWGEVVLYLAIVSHQHEVLIIEDVFC